MKKNTSISLGEHFNEFIENQVQSGRYNTASDVIITGLRMLEEHEIRLKTLHNALISGQQSGEAKIFDSASFLKRMHSQHE